MKPTTKTHQPNPFVNLHLDAEEQAIEDALAREEFQSTGNLEEIKKVFQEAATRHQELRKSKRITLRVNQTDLLTVQARAKQIGIPYQTLLSALIRQYAEGRTKIEL